MEIFKLKISIKIQMYYNCPLYIYIYIYNDKLMIQYMLKSTKK